jgi:hypothetical protein
VKICRDEGHVLVRKACRTSDLKKGALPETANRPVIRNNLNEYDERVLRTEIYQEDVGEVFVRWDFQADQIRKLIVGPRDFVTAFAQEYHAGLTKETFREFFDNRLRDDGTRPVGQSPCLAVRESHRYTAGACDCSFPDQLDSRKCSGG